MIRFSRYFPVLFLVLIRLGATEVRAQPDKESDVLADWRQFRAAPNALYDHLTQQAYKYLDARSEEVQSTRSAADWRQRQLITRKALSLAVGPFPVKTPLNARVVRTIEKDGYRVEHVVYESRPGFFVTSSLFIPNSVSAPKKAPAVVYCSGHADEAYRSPTYQHVMLNLVKKGFVVFAFDPMGQGERYNYVDPKTGETLVGGPTREHYYAGAQVFLTGGSLANYMIWDGIRAVDYLRARPEVDPARIGITGRSGGGTQSAYIAAFDERIRAVAPENYLTTYTRLLQSIGPQDAEQHFPGQIARGLDHSDFLIVRAPKPALMITTTNDYFSVQGTEENAAEVARAYRAFGQPEHFARVEDYSPHASTPKNREAMYAFFQKYLDHPGSPADVPTDSLTADELRVTSTGQAITSLGGETVFSLNQRQAEAQRKLLQAERAHLKTHLPNVLVSARKLSGYVAPEGVPKPVRTGSVRKEGYTIEKYFVRGEGDYVLPYLLLVPQQPNGKAVLYLHPKGKAEAVASTPVQVMAGKGYRVLLPDLPGYGELGPGDWQAGRYFRHAPYDGLSYQIWTAALMVSRSIVGIRAGDVVRLAQVLRAAQPGEISAVAVGNAAPVLLHAAAFDKTIGRIALMNPLLSYHSLVTTQYYKPEYVENTVPAALQFYDLPDLAASLAPRELLIVDPVNGAGEPLGDENEEYQVVEAAYQGRGLQMSSGGEKALADWLR